MGDLIEINRRQIRVKEYKGQRVVTLQEVDEVHERPDGTARVTFNRRKDKFKPDIDFFELNYAEWQDILSVCLTYGQDSEQNQGAGGYRGSMVFFTERGYLKLVKPFDDELSWDVQTQLIDGYFRAKDALESVDTELKKTILVIGQAVVRMDQSLVRTEAKVDVLGHQVRLFGETLDEHGNEIREIRKEIDEKKKTKIPKSTKNIHVLDEQIYRDHSCARLAKSHEKLRSECLRRALSGVFP